MGKLATLIVIVLVASVPVAYAADDGQTQPRLSMAFLNYYNTSTDIIATTNGAGNIKGIMCLNTIGASIVVNVYVNGGAAQTLFMDVVPVDSDGRTGWVPMNVRFTSSIRVQKVRSASPGYNGYTQCTVSWALD